MLELYNRVLSYESTVKSWRNNYNSTEWREASQLNKLLNNIPLNRSPRCECIEDLFFQLKRKNINQQIVNMENQNFKMQDVVIMLHGCTPVGKNSTDEQIIAMLKVSPAHIKFVKEKPSNWREICGLKEDSKGTKAKPKAKEAAKVDASKKNISLSGDNTEDEKAEESNEDEVDNSEREEELISMTNGALKTLLIERELELPKPANKENLVKAVIEAESK